MVPPGRVDLHARRRLMDVQTFAESMGRTLPTARYAALLPAWNAALIQADCTTVNRVAMLTAQVGHESVGLKYMSEIWSPTAVQLRYQGRADLGNLQPGDGSRFRGHGPIQITGRFNHTAVSKWAHSKGYVPSSTYFVDRPEELGGDRYGFLGVVWYWTVARARLNAYADAGDILAATKAVNGGTNGLADRTARWHRCRALGTRLLPTPEPSPGGDDMDARQDAMLTGIYHQMSGSPKPGEWPGWDSFTGEQKATLLDFVRRTNRDVAAIKQQVVDQNKALANIVLLLTRADEK